MVRIDPRRHVQHVEKKEDFLLLPPGSIGSYGSAGSVSALKCVDNEEGIHGLPSDVESFLPYHVMGFVSCAFLVNFDALMMLCMDIVAGSATYPSAESLRS